MLDKGTVIRTAALLLALTNQILVLAGKSPLPIDSELLNQLIAVLFTTITSVIAWFKNNYVTKTGKKQKKVLLEKGLAGKRRRRQKK